MIDERHRIALDRVLELVVLLNHDMTHGLARDGLTTSRAHVLWELRRRGPSTQRVLADALGVSARTVTGLVDGLEATGFVNREPHPTDRRAILVTPTPLADKTVSALETEQAGFARLLFADMSDARLDCFTAGLGEVLARLREQGIAERYPEEKP
jgi:DNA-binding MarR family transcriptional regulator